MKYFPIFVSVDQRRIVVSGGGEVALAKLRLLLKTTAKIEVYCETPIHEVVMLGQSGRIDLVLRALGAGDAAGALLVYVADEDPEDAAKSASVARLDNVLVNVVDNLEASAFLTPAIVDRDPVFPPPGDGRSGDGRARPEIDLAARKFCHCLNSLSDGFD